MADLCKHRKLTCQIASRNHACSTWDCIQSLVTFNFDLINVYTRKTKINRYYWNRLCQPMVNQRNIRWLRCFNKSTNYIPEYRLEVILIRCIFAIFHLVLIGHFLWWMSLTPELASVTVMRRAVVTSQQGSVAAHKSLQYMTSPLDCHWLLKSLVANSIWAVVL